jgi:cysteine desulfurase
MAGYGTEYQRVKKLRDRLETTILREIPNTFVNGDRDNRLPNTSNIAFEFVEAEAVLMLLDQVGICASSGSACTTGSLDPSHVLTAMGLTPMRARGCVRFSLGIYNTDEDVDFVIQHLPPIIRRLRDISPLNPSHPDNDSYDIEAARQKHEIELAKATSNA